MNPKNLKINMQSEFLRAYEDKGKATDKDKPSRVELILELRCKKGSEDKDGAVDKDYILKIQLYYKVEALESGWK